MKQPQDRRPKKRPAMKRVRLASDMDVLGRYNDMKKQKASRTGWTDEQEAILASLEKQVAEDTVEFTLRAVGAKKFFRLVKDNPPTQEQVEEALKQEDEVNWNGETFPPALVWACLLEPQMPKEEFDEMWEDDLSVGEQMMLLMAALEVNQGTPLVDVGNG